MLGFTALGEQGLGQFGDSDTSVTVAADAGVITITGHDASIIAGRFIVAEAASFTVTGGDAEFIYQQAIQAEAATLTLTGYDADIIITRTLTADGASITMTGNVVDFVKRQSGLNIRPSGGAKGLRMTA